MAHSVLRPACRADQRLRHWLPLTSIHSRSENSLLTDDDVDRVLSVLAESWAASTKATYGAGLLIFHVFCDERGVAEELRCPASPALVLLFVARCAGGYAGGTLANYVSGLKAWHILHGQPWRVNNAEMKAALDGASRLAPASSKRAPRKPMTLNTLSVICNSLDHNDSFDAAVLACLTTTFYAAARLGEFTVPNANAFHPDKHISASRVSFDVKDRSGATVTVLHLPWTKTSPTGQDAYWASQLGPTDPRNTMSNHLSVNRPRPEDPLFAYRSGSSVKHLTRQTFIRRVDSIQRTAGLGAFKGHSLRIGGTLEYLLRGVPFESVKTLGQWSSDSFQRYLREHATILAPYLQESPAAYEFTLRTLNQ